MEDLSQHPDLRCRMGAYLTDEERLFRVTSVTRTGKARKWIVYAEVCTCPDAIPERFDAADVLLMRLVVPADGAVAACAA